MLVSGPMAGVLVVPVVLGGLASNGDIEAEAERDGAGDIEVGYGLRRTWYVEYDAWPGYTT